MQAFRAVALSFFFIISPANAQEAIPIVSLIAKRSVELNSNRIALIKTNLRIADHQEDEWTKFEYALKELSRERAFRKATLMVENDKRTSPLSPAELLTRQAEALKQRARDMQALAQAAEPLYVRLDDDQRKRADELVRVFAQRLFVDDDPRYRRARSY